MYLKPISLNFKGNILFYDVRLIDSVLYLITYQGKFFEPDINKLSIHCNGENLKLKNFKYDEPEPMSWIEGYLNKEYTEYNFKIKYEDCEYDIKINNIKSKIENGICISTLFKDDYELIEIFTKYYKLQGVNKFYLYYNGDMNKVYHKLYKSDDIIYKEWNYVYFNHQSKYYPNISHAQMTCMTLAKIEHSKFHEYIMMNDLDEFVAHCDMKLIDYFNKGVIVQSRRFFNNWAVIEKIEDDKIYIYYNKNFNCERGKLVYHHSFEGGYSIHRNKVHPGIKLYTYLDDNKLNMLHVASTETPERIFEFDKNICEKIILNI
jgi:hypothetical protein